MPRRQAEGGAPHAGRRRAPRGRSGREHVFGLAPEGGGGGGGPGGRRGAARRTGAGGVPLGGGAVVSTCSGWPGGRGGAPRLAAAAGAAVLIAIMPATPRAARQALITLHQSMGAPY